MRARWLPLIVDGSWNPEARRVFHNNSGAYALRYRATGAVLYVGESHTGRGWKTLLRHFQDASGKFAKVRESFTHARPETLEVALFVTSRGLRTEARPDKKAEVLEAALIKKYTREGHELYNVDDKRAKLAALRTSGRDRRLGAWHAKQGGDPDADFDFGANITREEERGAFDDLIANPGRSMELRANDMLTRVKPPFTISRGNRAKFQNASVRGTFGEPKRTIITWIGAGYESLEEKELCAWAVKALSAWYKLRNDPDRLFLFPGATASTGEEAAFWLTCVRAMPAIDIPLAPRPWTAGRKGGLSVLDGRDWWEIAETADEGIAQLVASLAELTDYSVMLKQLGKKATAAEALRLGEAWDGDPRWRARWYQLSAWLGAAPNGGAKPARAKPAPKAAAPSSRWPRFSAGDRITGPFTGKATVMHASPGQGRHPPTYSVRTDRGVLESVNEDQPLAYAPVGRADVLRFIDAGRAHSRPVDEMPPGPMRDVLGLLLADGEVKKLPARGRFPDRYVVTTQGSHALGTFDSDDRNFRDESEAAGARARVAQRAKPSGYGVEESGRKKAGQLRMFNPRGPVEVRDAAIVEENGYKFPERNVDGFIRTTTHKTEATAQAAAAKDGAVSFILRWQSEIGNYVFALYIPEALWYERQAAKRAAAKRNPGSPALVVLGDLVSVVYKDASGRRRTLSWGARSAPLLAYKPASGRLVLVFGPEVVGDGSATSAKEYKRTHWGKAGDGDRLDGDVLGGKAPKLGTALEITYATQKGADPALVNYWHKFGDFGDGSKPRRFIPPSVAAAKVGGRQLVRLDGGTYRVDEHGIVG